MNRYTGVNWSTMSDTITLKILELFLQNSCPCIKTFWCLFVQYHLVHFLLSSLFFVQSSECNGF